MQNDHVLTPRQIADRYVETLADLNPITGTALGIRPGVDALPDYSPAGHEAMADAERATLAELDAVAADSLPVEERRAARLLRERLTASLAIHDAGEHLRDVSNLFSPVQSLRSVFLLMPTASADDWAVIGRRLRNVGEAARGYRALLAAGVAQGLRAAPRQAETVIEQIDAWLAADWYTTFVADGSDDQQDELVASAGPPGSAAAPYYTRPSLDFVRPGRTWLPTLGATRFPVWGLVSTWYHEGVPGHHLQLAQWVHVAERLSRYQVSVGSVSATTEGWALYAERLMDELGYLTDPARRLGYLDAQMMRAMRVIIDIGMHLRLRIPASERFHPGEVWTPELGREFFGAHRGREPAFIDSEIVRYLGMPGQAISYKLGERAWLAGRDAARAAHGAEFDLKCWHMAALSLGSLGLDDLTDELARLP